MVDAPTPPASPAVESAERAAFHDYILCRYGAANVEGAGFLSRLPSGRYAKDKAEWAWQAWLESAKGGGWRAALAAPPTPRGEAPGSTDREQIARKAFEWKFGPSWNWFDGGDRRRNEAYEIADFALSTPRAEIGGDARARAMSALAVWYEWEGDPQPWWDALQPADQQRALRAFAATPDAASVTPDAGEDERVRLARELAAYLPKAAEEAEENGWMQWGADFRQAAETINALTAASHAKNAPGGVA
jgi:hypothetical protein